MSPWPLIKYSFLLLCTFVVVSNAWAGDRCKSGLELPYLVTSSDAIAEVRISDLSLGIQALPVRPIFKLEFVVDKLIKPPLITPIGKGSRGQLVLRGVDIGLLRNYQTFLVFLKYRSPNTWEASRCSFLPITGGGSVRDACTAISDLFNKTPYEREKKCVLVYPPNAPLVAVRKEIYDFFGSERRFDGAGTVNWVGGFSKDEPFRVFSIKMDARNRKRFFNGRKLVNSRSIKLYLPNSLIGSDSKVSSILRVGRRIEFKGTWTMGSFVLDFLK